MITVNALINQAFQRCSLVGDGQAATGSQAMNALFDLQSLIAELNGQNLILSDVEKVFVKMEILAFSIRLGLFFIGNYSDTIERLFMYFTFEQIYKISFELYQFLLE